MLTRLTYEARWRDVGVMIGVTTLSFLSSDYFNLNEALYAWTRREARFQLDELPIGMLVLLICLMWLSWRRYVQARREVCARRIAEARLGAALAENRRLPEGELRVQGGARKNPAREHHSE